jgi:hypothetical protein
MISLIVLSTANICPRCEELNWNAADGELVRDMATIGRVEVR